ncbi:MAG: hypothetical protein K2M17_02090, partial [Bacilli bacterium]|nr:hypothetical protein [Bacilli bacterium]
ITSDTIVANLVHEKGTEEIDKFYYAIIENKNEIAYVESRNNKVKRLSAKEEQLQYKESIEPTFTFTDLKAQASYTIYSYAVDKNGIKSNVYETSLTTKERFDAPIITNVDYESDLNSISLEVTAEKGTNSIAYYHYSKDDGKTWEKTTENTHTFSDLVDTTTYKVKIKLEDSEGNFSTEYYADIDTETYNYPVVTDLTVDESSITYSGFKVTATATEGTAPIKNYYFSVSTDKEIWTKESAAQTTNSYTFTGLLASIAYYVKVRVVDNNNKETSYTTPSTIMTPAIPVTLTNKIKGLYTTDGVNNLYYHDGSGSYENVDQESGEGEYRFGGQSETTNNYVCFGSTDATCPVDNLYRIIGVFGNRVKLIKSDYATSTLLGTDGDYYGEDEPGLEYRGSQTIAYSYYWNKASGTSTWSKSQLNQINLNTNFINNIGSEWANLIDTATWNVGGMNDANGRTSSNIAKKAYDHEVGANKINTSYNAKIGLMYLSDYYYAAAPTYWSYKGYVSSGSSDYREAVNDNWMYLGEIEWSISRQSDNTMRSLCISNVGYAESLYVTRAYAVRPVFYLKYNVITTGGNGSISSPYRVL